MKFKLPENFSFGSAFSGPQTEGNKNKKMDNIFDRDYKDNTDKYFERKHVVNNFYEKYKEDIKLAKEMGLDELRTSIQWSRLMPDGKNLDKDAVDFYNNVINEMIKNNITPTLALHHFDMPVWAQEKGGWLSREVVNLFVVYAKKAFEIFGDRIKAWFTFNEPGVPVQAGYLMGLHPPYIKDAKKSVQVQWNTLIAHHMCVKAHKEMKLNSKYGAIIDFSAAMPASKSKEDTEAAELLDMWKWRNYADPMFLGKFPQKYENKLQETGLIFKEEPGDRKLIKENTIDYFGINYYAPSFVKAPKAKPKKGELDKWGMPKMYESYTPPYLLMNSSRGWGVYPYGIYFSIMKVKELYGDEITIYISENGMGVENEHVFKNKNGIIEDDYRILFFQMHLAFVAKAIQDGAKVRGYHSWGYIDNWSWSNAYKNRYGSISIDVNNGKRTLKKSASWWKNIAKIKEIDVEDYILKSPFLQPIDKELK